MSDVYDKLVRARMRARMGFKYFGALLYRLPWTEVPGHGTMSVDARGRIRVDPLWLQQVSTAELAGAFVHEVGHLVLRHGKRFESHLQHRAISESDVSRHQYLWNIAGDLEWNETIRVFCRSPYNVRSSETKGTEPLLSLTDGALLAEQFGLPAGESAEFYFDRLCEMSPEVVDKGLDCRSDLPSPAGEGEEAGGSSSEKQQSTEQEPNESSGHGGGSSSDDRSAVGRGRCGGCAARSKEPEKSEDDTQSGPTTQELNDILRSVWGQVRAAAARGQGFVPDTLRRIADEELAPAQVPWQEVVRRHVRMGEAQSSGMVDYTYRRPSRRWNPMGVILPSLYAPRPTVAIVADTSGSMGSDDLASVLQETRGCLRYADKVWFIPTDARAHECIQLRSIAQARDVMIGGGGTDMGAGLEAAGEKKPSLTVVVTDGITDWPAYMPAGNRSVLIVRVNEDGRNHPTPDWAQVVDVSTRGATE